MKNLKFLSFFIPVIFFVLQINNIYSQSIYPYTVWSKVYNAPSNLQDSAVAICKNASGMVFVAGWSLGTSTNADYVTLRYNPATGDTLWVNRISNANEDKITAMTCDNGAVYVTGWSFSGTNRDVLTAKINAANGQTIWARTYNGPAGGGDYAYSIATDANFVYVCGRTDVGGASKYLVIKYNTTTGDTVWTYKYTGTFSTTADLALSIKVDGTSNVYVTGKVNFQPGPGDWVTIKLSSSGALLWEKRYAGSSNSDDGAVALVLDNTGSNVFVTGYGTRISVQDIITIKYSASAGDSLASAVYNNGGIDIPIAMLIDGSGNIYITGLSLNAQNKYDYVTIKYNFNLVQQWASRYGNSDGYSLVNHISPGTNNDLYVTGSSFRTGQGYDYLTIRYNATTGDTIWTARFNGTANLNDYGSQVAVIDSTAVFVTGSAVFSPATTASMNTIRYSNQIVGIRPISTQVPAKFNVEQNYPNPFNPSTTFNFDLPKEGLVSITVYDALGREVEIIANENLEPGKYEVKWDASKYSSGMYFYTVRTEDFAVTKKMILAK